MITREKLRQPYSPYSGRASILSILRTAGTCTAKLRLGPFDIRRCLLLTPAGEFEIIAIFGLLLSRLDALHTKFFLLSSRDFPGLERTVKPTV